MAPTKPKTFWLKTATIEEIERLQAAAADPDQIIAEIKNAIEEKVQELINSRPHEGSLFAKRPEQEP